MDWLNITEIGLQIAACWACYMSGKMKGVDAVLELLLSKKIITEADLKKLED